MKMLQLPQAVIVTLPPPTPNGGLHVGHLSGPFLSADVFARAARLQGAAVFTSCYSDVNQTYVRVTAARQGRDPHELAAFWTKDIVSTLESYAVDIDDYFPVDEDSQAYVRALFVGLYQRGILVKKPFPVYRSRTTGEHLDEAGVSGFCPSCLSRCKCGICESCSSINDPLTLLRPSVTLTGEQTLDIDKVELMVLELERFRENIEAVYRNNPRFRTRFKWVVGDALARALPDFPVTTPGSWGFPIDHPDFAGQVINAWPEIMAQQIYGHQRALARRPELGAQPAVVNFYGFDNAYFYAIVHAAMLSVIDDGKWLPFASINNEFYNLEHSKFSTSNNHVIWAGELLARHGADEIRFFAAWNNPGMEKANFREGDMAAVLETGLQGLWKTIATGYNRRLLEEGQAKGTPSAQTLAAGAAAVARIYASYSVEHFHLRQAAEDVLHLLTYLADVLTHAEVALIDVAYLLRCLAVATGPITPVAAERIHQALCASPLAGMDGPVVFSGQPLPVAVFGSPGGTAGTTALELVANDRDARHG